MLNIQHCSKVKMISKIIFIVSAIFMSVLFISCNVDGNDHGTNQIIFYDSVLMKDENGVFDNSESCFIKQFNNVMKADPVQDVKFSLMKRDYRFVAVRDFFMILPYVSDKANYLNIINKFGSKVIAGTSDAQRVDLPPLQEKAINYAEKYNIQLYKALSQMKVLPE